MRVRTYRYVYFVRKGHMQISRYAAARAADYGVAFPDLLNTEADEPEGQLQHTKLFLLSSKTNRTVLKWFEAHVQRYSKLTLL